MEGKKTYKYLEHEKNLFSIIHLVKRAMDKWSQHTYIAIGNPAFHVAYIPFFMNIGHSGISNNELAAKLNMTKQGTSRIIRELIQLNLVYAVKDEKDARAAKLFFTEKGTLFYTEVIEKTQKLLVDLIDVVGKNNYETTLKTILNMSNYIEELNKK